jgi:hypothetical protein
MHVEYNMLEEIDLDFTHDQKTEDVLMKDMEELKTLITTRDMLEDLIRINDSEEVEESQEGSK